MGLGTDPGFDGPGTKIKPRTEGEEMDVPTATAETILLACGRATFLMMSLLGLMLPTCSEEPEELMEETSTKESPSLPGLFPGLFLGMMRWVSRLEGFMLLEVKELKMTSYQVIKLLTM